jgi:hypothetical protein
MSEPGDPSAQPPSEEEEKVSTEEPQGSSGVVDATQASVAAASQAADEAMAAPVVAGGADPKQQLLEELRDLEIQLFGFEVVEQVKQLPDDQKQAFAAARLHLTSVINQLNTAQLQDIADQLEQHAGELQAGISQLGQSLNSLQGASNWTAAINSIIGVVGQIIPLL